MKKQSSKNKIKDLLPNDGLTVGEKIHKYRTMRSVSIKELSTAVKISESYEKQIESGEIEVDFEILLKITSYLDIPVQLLMRTNHKK